MMSTKCSDWGKVLCPGVLSRAESVWGRGSFCNCNRRNERVVVPSQARDSKKNLTLNAKGFPLSSVVSILSYPLELRLHLNVEYLDSHPPGRERDESEGRVESCELEQLRHYQNAFGAQPIITAAKSHVRYETTRPKREGGGRGCGQKRNSPLISPPSLSHSEALHLGCMANEQTKFILGKAKVAF